MCSLIRNLSLIQNNNFEIFPVAAKAVSNDGSSFVIIFMDLPKSLFSDGLSRCPLLLYVQFTSFLSVTFILINSFSNIPPSSVESSGSWNITISME